MLSWGLFKMLIFKEIVLAGAGCGTKQPPLSISCFSEHILYFFLRTKTFEEEKIMCAMGNSKMDSV